MTNLSNTNNINPALLMTQAVQEYKQEMQSYGENSWYDHIVCKCGTSGSFDIFRPTRGEEKKVEFLNPSVITEHRIAALEGDIIDLSFGFAQSIYGAKDVQGDESPYFRCQTSELIIRNPNNPTKLHPEGEEYRIISSKPLSNPIFSPHRSSANPNEPNAMLTRELQGGLVSELWGQVDKPYAERVGIESRRKCVDCVRAGTNRFYDKDTNKDYLCKLTGEMLFLVRRVAHLAQDPNNMSGSILKWIDIEDLNINALNRPVVFRIPLNRGDMFNGLGGEWGFDVTLGKNGIPTDLQSIGNYMDDVIQGGSINVDYSVTLPGIERVINRRFKAPTQLYLVKLNQAIAASKTHVILAKSCDDPEVLKQAERRANHALYMYEYEKGLANATIAEDQKPPVWTEATGDLPFDVDEEQEEVVETPIVKPTKANTVEVLEESEPGTTEQKVEKVEPKEGLLQKSLFRNS